jgi:dTDP-L-rhamnose 4-epimerase
MKNILISGGAGFIGSNLAIRLVETGYNVRVLDNLSSQIHGESPETTSPLYQSIYDKVELIKGSVTNRTDWMNSLKGQDAIVHLAAETGTGQSMYEISRYCDVNIGGTALLLDILTNTKHTIKKIIVASSRAIYGEGKYQCSEHGIVYPDARKEPDMIMGDYGCKCPFCQKTVSQLPTSEDSKIMPSSVYGITKQNQEQMVLVIGKAINIPSVAFRYQNVYGPGQSLSNPYTGILSIFSNLLRAGKKINIFEDGKESRDFVYIDDVVNATILGLENVNADYEVFNVGSGISTDVISVANHLKSSYKSNSELHISGDFRIGDIRHNCADITKVSNLLSYKPLVEFEKGIYYFTQWVNNTSNREDSNYEKSLNDMKSRGLFYSSEAV